MTVPGNIDALLLGGQRGYQIERSLRFNSADSAYLNRTPASAGNRKTWTYSAWTKICASGQNDILSVYNSATDFCRLYFDLWSSNQIALYWYNGSLAATVQSANVLRDPAAWYHLMWVLDTTQSTASNRVKLYVNGVQITTFTSGGALNYPSQNSDLPINNNVAHNIGALSGTATFNGYLTEINFIDGQALTPSSFGETDTITGVWKPKKYAGTYGTNGFYLKFADNSGTTSTTLGKDSSGNGNNWTPNNFSVTAGAGNDSMIDTPTPYADGGNGRGNYCTLNGAVETTSNGKATLSNGNLECSVPRLCAINGSFGITSGKWYWEVQPNDLANGPYGMGVFAIGKGITHGDTQYIFVDSTGYRYTPGDAANQSGWGPTYNGSTDIIGLALDADARTLGFNKNGGSFTTFDYSSYSSMSGGVTPAWKSGGNLGTSGAIFNFGQRAFAYTPPSGFLALNTQNLPEPSIKKPSSYMDVVLWTGNGAAGRSITGLNFSPDLVWLKNRSDTYHHQLHDAVRGASTGALYSGLTNAEDPNFPLTSFDSSGFTLGNTASLAAQSQGSQNYNGNGFVAWCWDKSATPGFDIVTYTGDGTNNRAISHSLGVAPSFIISKVVTGSSTEGWPVWHKSFSSYNSYVQLNQTSAVATDSNIYGGSGNNAPTSTVWYVGPGGVTNTSGRTYVAYLFSEVAGFSKFGSYTGNGSTDGVFVHCGFRPKLLIWKRTDSSANWFILDAARNTYNVVDKEMYPDQSAAESTFTDVDFLSNGFKLRASAADRNGSGATFIFAAWAESPFKYSLAR